MSRGLSTDIQNALASGKFGIASLLKLSLNTTYYLTNHQKNIVFNSATYQPLGYIVNLDDIVEQASMNTGAISITLSAATTTIITDLFTNGHIDKKRESLPRFNQRFRRGDRCTFRDIRGNDFVFKIYGKCDEFIDSFDGCKSMVAP